MIGTKDKIHETNSVKVKGAVKILDDLKFLYLQVPHKEKISLLGKPSKEKKSLVIKVFKNLKFSPKTPPIFT